MNRRELVKLGIAGAAAWALPVSFGKSADQARTSRIDRMVLVRRHNPVVHHPDPFAALTVGNGTFAFTGDITGLQSFPDAYHRDFPLCTASHWGWHTMPAPAGVQIEEFRYRQYDAHGRKVGYATDAKGQEPLFHWLRQNPHRLHLGQIGFEFAKSNGSSASLSDVAAIEQTLDLWSGIVESCFEVEGKPVRVQTCCHPELDLLAVRVDSPLLSEGRIRVLVAFPYASHEVDMSDWHSPEKHHTRCHLESRRADIVRQLDDCTYHVSLRWSEGDFIQRVEHEYILGNTSKSHLEFTCLFAPHANREALPSVQECLDANRRHWSRFWTEGGAVDLSDCTDGRAGELERRIVLSQYNTALHCAGEYPSQETGLLFNSWYGKFHLEMHWWHSVHFVAWNRFELFERSMNYYQRILPVAREIAKRQGYAGARWPKMVGPDGHDAPSPIGPLLIWQQPHPIYYAELCYRRRPTRDTLDRWAQVVFETADFMADYAVYEKERGQYVLGPPIMLVSENTPPLTSQNPAFELAYWRFGLRLAQQWRHRLGLTPEPAWADVLDRLSPLPQAEGRYLKMEHLFDTYARWNWEHPAMLGALGAQPGDGVDHEIMRNTLKKVMEVWEWDRCWGWDFPMAAMTAACLGEGELAVQALLIDSPKNRYLPNGHVYQAPNLSAYLPGNGGLLAAVATMVSGISEQRVPSPPGFPPNAKWHVRWEGIQSLLG